MLPEDNELLDCTYEIKKILCSMSMNYERIHAYLNDCILYRNEYESLEECAVCGRSPYKTNKKSSVKVLWCNDPRF